MLKTLKNSLRTGDNDFREVLRHSFWAFVLIGAATVSQFLFDLVLARIFGAEGSGTFYLVFSVLVVIALVGRLGFDRAVVRFLPPLLSQKKWPEAHGLQKTALRLTLLLTIPLAFIIYFSSPFLAETFFNKPELTSYFQIFAFAVPGLSLTYIYAGLLRSAKFTKASLFVERVAVYIFGIISLITLGVSFGLKAAFWGFVISIYLAMIIGFIYTKRRLPHVSKPKLFSKKVLLFTSLPLMSVTFSNQMLTQANIMILGVMSTANDVGVFNVALKVSLLMGMILTAISTIMDTKISEFHASSKNLQALAGKTAALGTVIALPLFAVMILAPELVLSFFGDDFKAGSTVLIILAIGQLINVGVGSVAHILAMSGYEKSLASVIGGTLLINIILSLLLVPHFGIAGAGIALGISIVIKNIILLYLVKKYLDIWSLPFSSLKAWASKINS